MVACGMTAKDTPSPDADYDPGPALRHRALLCAAMLAAGRPLTPNEAAQLLGLGPGAVNRLVSELKEVLKREDLGLEVEEVAGGYRLVVDPSLTADLAGLLAPPPLPQLSSAALETLALIAYGQPLTRGELEAARGISCGSTLDTLQERELIKVMGRKDVVGKPLLYGTTVKFLLEFGLKSLEDLPPLSERPAEFLRG